MFRVLFLTLCVTFASGAAIHSSMKMETLPGENLAPGGSIKRKCVVTSTLKWDIFWLLPDGTKTNGPLLEVNNLSPANSGQYTCIAIEKQMGQRMASHFSISFSADIKLNIQALPGERLAIGGSLKRKCFLSPAQSDAEWSLEWKKPDGSKTSGGLLEINNLQEQNTGKYSCIATHKASGKSLVAIISVHLKAFKQVHLQIVPGEGNKLVYGGVLSQVCKIDDDGWQLHWLKPNKETVPGGNLVVRNLSDKDFGVYTCIAKKNGRTVGNTFTLG